MYRAGALLVLKEPIVNWQQKMHCCLLGYSLRRSDPCPGGRRSGGMAPINLPHREDSPSLLLLPLKHLQTSTDSTTDAILAAAQSLADKLREKKAFTNTATFDLKCEVCNHCAGSHRSRH